MTTARGCRREDCNFRCRWELQGHGSKRMLQRQREDAMCWKWELHRCYRDFAARDCRRRHCAGHERAGARLRCSSLCWNTYRHRYRATGWSCHEERHCILQKSGAVAEMHWQMKQRGQQGATAAEENSRERYLQQHVFVCAGQSLCTAFVFSAAPEHAASTLQIPKTSAAAFEQLPNLLLPNSPPDHAVSHAPTLHLPPLPTASSFYLCQQNFPI